MVKRETADPSSADSRQHPRPSSGADHARLALTSRSLTTRIPHPGDYLPAEASGQKPHRDQDRHRQALRSTSEPHSLRRPLTSVRSSCGRSAWRLRAGPRFIQPITRRVQRHDHTEIIRIERNGSRPGRASPCPDRERAGRPAGAGREDRLRPRTRGDRA
jgi:hypothetical protein